MDKFHSNIKYILPLFLLLLLVFGLTYAHQGNIIIDCGREIYYPKKILEGSILYQDLFNIYGPFSYLYNAFLFKIFGINLNVLYISGILTATGIFSLIYLISRLFFDKLLSSSLTALSIVIGAFSFHIFNYTFPYSFGMTYGLIAFLASLYCLLNFVRNNNFNFYYLSAFFAGLAITNKYEFLPYILIYFYLIFKNKISLKDNILAILSILITPILSFGFLFLQGLQLNSFIQNIKDIYTMSNTITLKYFYTVSGLIFQKQTLGLLFRNFLLTIFPLFMIYHGTCYLNKSKAKAYFLYGLSIFFTFKLISLETFIFLPVVLFITACILLKKQNLDIKILIISSLLASLKVFWATALNSYGIFFIPILLISIITLVKKDYHKYISVYFIILTIAFFSTTYPLRKDISHKVQTNYGKIYVSDFQKDTSKNIIKFISTETKSSDKILILPEGLFFNFLTNRNSNDYFNSYIPLYLETFGDKRIIKNLKSDKPDYIIIHNLPTSNYYFKSICRDYAFETCDFIKNEYTPKGLLNDDFSAYIFKKK